MSLLTMRRSRTFADYVGGGREGGYCGVIADKAVNGTVSLLLSRLRPYHESANYRIHGADTSYGDATEVAVEFSFLIKRIGEYGFTSIIGTDATGLSGWGDGTTNFLSVKTNDADKKITVFVHDNGQLVSIKNDLVADKVYTLTAVFKLGTKEYTVAIDGEVIGSYTYFEPMTGITGLRLDEHGYADTQDHLSDEVYFDDIKIGAVVNKNGGSSTPSDPSTTPDVPNNNTGDSSVIFMAAAILLCAGTAVAVLKKKAY